MPARTHKPKAICSPLFQSVGHKKVSSNVIFIFAHFLKLVYFKECFCFITTDVYPNVSELISVQSREVYFLSSTVIDIKHL